MKGQQRCGVFGRRRGAGRVGLDRGRRCLWAATGTGITLLVAGCYAQPEGDIETAFTVGRTSSGIVFDGQIVVASGTVKAGHIYGVAAGLSGISAGASSASLEAVARGATLPEPFAFNVDPSLDTLDVLVVPESDGDLIVELRFGVADVASASEGTLESLRTLVSGAAHARYQVLVTDFGFDDHGSSPRSAVPLSIGIQGERTGTLILQDDADYFTLEVEAESSYELRIEATHPVNVVSGTEDRFGQINFSVPSSGGVLVSATATAGVPGSSTFSSEMTEAILLRLARGDPSSVSDTTIQYAISVIETVPESE